MLRPLPLSACSFSTHADTPGAGRCFFAFYVACLLQVYLLGNPLVVWLGGVAVVMVAGAAMLVLRYRQHFDKAFGKAGDSAARSVPGLVSSPPCTLWDLAQVDCHPAPQCSSAPQLFVL